jgi:hypothetical protein
LLFGSNPSYTISDVKLFTDAARMNPINIMADNANKKIQCMSAKDEMYLEIKGATVYKISTEFKGNDCCSNRVKSLKIDNIPVCTCCSDVISVPVK